MGPETRPDGRTRPGDQTGAGAGPGTAREARCEAGGVRLPRVLLRVLVLLLLALLALRLLGGERGTLTVLLVGALPLTLLPAGPALLAGLLLRDRVVVAGAALLVAGQALVVAPALSARPLSAAAREAPRLRVVVANLYVLNQEPQRTGEALRLLRPDVLLVPELDADGLAGLRASGLLDDLPLSVVDDGARSETVGLFSRLPLVDPELHRAGSRVLPNATVRVGTVDVRVLGAHTLPPVSVLQVPWRAGLRDLEREVRASEPPVVLLGDLNADRDSAAFRRLLSAGLRDAHDERGRGLARTWPAGFPLLQLDHVLVRDGRGGGLEVVDVREARLPGTDHRAVVADLAVVPWSTPSGPS